MFRDLVLFEAGAYIDLGRESQRSNLSEERLEFTFGDVVVQVLDAQLGADTASCAAAFQTVGQSVAAALGEELTRATVVSIVLPRIARLVVRLGRATAAASPRSAHCSLEYRCHGETEGESEARMQAGQVSKGMKPRSGSLRHSPSLRVPAERFVSPHGRILAK